MTRKTPTYSIETITPDKAKEMLLTNNMNRNPSQATIEKHVNQIRKGRWHPHGQPMMVSWDGELLDGQHRLSAVIKAKATVNMSVVRGVDPAARTTMDRTRTRRASDDLTMEGYTNSIQIVSIAKAVGVLQSGKFGDVDTIDSREFIEDNYEALDWYTHLPKKALPSRSAYVAAPMVWAWKMGWSDAAREFMDEVVNYRCTVPTKNYIDWLKRHVEDKVTKYSAITMMMMTLACLNDLIAGNEPQRLIVSTRGYDALLNAGYAGKNNPSTCQWSKGCVHDKLADSPYCLIHRAGRYKKA